MSLSLISAFEKFGSKPSNRLHSLSAIAADGAMVLNCSYAHFGHPERGVLRYEDRLSREAPGTKYTELLSQHLTLARDGALPVRMIVTSALDASRRNRSFHVRTDLIGRVVSFDGDHFVVDFTRREELHETITIARRKKAR
jgi:hypothetical protein